MDVQGRGCSKNKRKWMYKAEDVVRIRENGSTVQGEVCSQNRRKWMYRQGWASVLF